ncbi:amino acid ABC transporter permease [Pseudolactococcus yaeyamensis]
MGELFQWRYVFKYFPKLLEVLPTTLGLVFGATLIGTVVGFLIALARIERLPILNQFATIFASFIRDTPVLVQLFLVYYAVPVLFQRTLGIDVNGWNKLIFVFIAFGLNAAAFFSEIFRSAVQSIPNSQRDAARAIGMTKRQMYQRIILPQTIRILIPTYGTMLVALLQDTAVAFTLGVIDVIGKVRQLGTFYYHSLEGYFDAAIIFIILSILIEKLFTYLDKRLTPAYARTEAPVAITIGPLDENSLAEATVSEKLTETATIDKLLNEREKEGKILTLAEAE